MANWYGRSRTNMVHIEDMEALKNSLEIFDISIYEREDGTVSFTDGDSTNGSFPSLLMTDEGEEIEFTWEKHVMPFVKENEMLIVMSSGAERRRYVTGYADAYVRRGTEVTSTGLDLNDIYAVAAVELGVHPQTRAEY